MSSTNEQLSSVWKSTEAVKVGIGAVLILLAALVFLVPDEAITISVSGYSIAVFDVLLLLSAIIAGKSVVRDGLRSIPKYHLGIDLLITIALIGAISIGYFEEAALLAVLFGIAELLEDYSIERAKQSLKDLIELSPDTATVKRGDSEETVPIEEISVGDVVLVQSGNKLPTDGSIEKGKGAIDEAPITGESVPVDKSVGDEVYAGTVLTSGYVEVKTEKEPENSVISKITQIVEASDDKETKKEQFVDRFASYYTPTVVLFALLTAIVPPIVLSLDWQTWFIRGLTLLVIACPCAFVISTPVSIVSAVSNAAKNGVLIKGGSYLESTSEIDMMAFDKTGTLTKGELTVSNVQSTDDSTVEDVLSVATAIEEQSNHPIARAITSYASDKSIFPLAEPKNFEDDIGRGVSAELNGERYYIGKLGTFSHNDLPDELSALDKTGDTIVYVGTDDEIIGSISIADEVREDAATVIQTLENQGVTTVMLTGDSENTASAVAEAAGIDTYHSELLPEEKQEKIESYQSSGATVAMVGDGVNDAPSLKVADLGISMGGVGSDIAIESGDIILMHDKLGKLLYLRRLSDKANGIIRQNIYSSLLVKLVLMLGVPLGYVTVAIAVLVGDMGMSLVVTGNAMRLSKDKE